jgi:hypothetical protein
LEVKAQVQNFLNKPVTLHFRQQRLAVILDEIEKKGGFRFSYNGNALSRDSLITMATDNKSIGETLSQLFGSRYEWQQIGNYIVITALLPRLSMVNVDMISKSNTYLVSGLIINEETGEELRDVSVYEKRQLAVTLSDAHGNFRLKLKGNGDDQITLTASKFSYKDTAISFLRTVEVSSENDPYSYSGHRSKGNRRGKLVWAGFLFLPDKRSKFEYS